MMRRPSQWWACVGSTRINIAPYTANDCPQKLNGKRRPEDLMVNFFLGDTLKLIVLEPSSETTLVEVAVSSREVKARRKARLSPSKAVLRVATVCTI